MGVVTVSCREKTATPKLLSSLVDGKEYRRREARVAMVANRTADDAMLADLDHADSWELGVCQRPFAFGVQSRKLVQ